MPTAYLKEYLNHTQNIQGKDIERMPYPCINNVEKDTAIKIVKSLLEEGKESQISFEHEKIKELNTIFSQVIK
jgi:hypothetical protein